MLGHETPSARPARVLRTSSFGLSDIHDDLQHEMAVCGPASHSASWLNTMRCHYGLHRPWPLHLRPGVFYQQCIPDNNRQYRAHLIFGAGKWQVLQRLARVVSNFPHFGHRRCRKRFFRFVRGRVCMTESPWQKLSSRLVSPRRKFRSSHHQTAAASQNGDEITAYQFTGLI